MTHTPYTTLFSLTRLDYISQRQIKEVYVCHTMEGFWAHLLNLTLYQHAYYMYM